MSYSTQPFVALKLSDFTGRKNHIWDMTLNQLNYMGKSAFLCATYGAPSSSSPQWSLPSESDGAFVFFFSVWQISVEGV